MGKMSFPENEERTSRTIMATRSASTREALIYKSEYKRTGDGEYRLPTIREIASLMGFPYVYQFSGSEGTKWRQIGNSVCPHQSSALAKAIRRKMGLDDILDNDLDFSSLEKGCEKIENLNTFKENVFNKPRKRIKNARFRRHVLKLGNMTVDLMNYHPEKKDVITKKWYVAAFFGTGEGYGRKIFEVKDKKSIEKILEKEFPHFNDYKKNINDNFSADVCLLQGIFENDLKLKQKANPILLLKKLSDMIFQYDCSRKTIDTNKLLQKDNVPLAHLMSAYGLLTLINN
jgi:DNA (cytosine-5)-methyltransferase 1